MNSKIVKRIAAFAACAVMLCTVAFAMVNIPTAPANGFVKDLANVITPSQEKAINDMVQELVYDNGAEVMILTVDFTDGMDIVDYTGEVFDEWRPGDRVKDNGLLLVMSIGDDDYYSMVGSGLEENMSANTLNDLLYEYLEPYFADQNYGAGAVEIADALVEEIGSIYGYDDNQVVDNSSSLVDSSTVEKIVVGIIMVILFLAIISAAVGAALRGPRRRYYNNYGDNYSSGYRGSYRSSYRPSRSSYHSSSYHSSSSGSRHSSSSRSSYHRSGGGSTRGSGVGRRSGGGRRR